MSKWIVGAFAVLFFLSSALAEEDCRLTLAASVPMDPSNRYRVLIPAELDGKPLRLLIDTGSPFTGITHHAAERLQADVHLITSDIRVSAPYAGGLVTHYAKVKQFKLGEMVAPRAQFFIMPREERDADGLLGADFLRQFDVEFDFANAKVNFFQPHPCKGKVVYWTQTEPVSVVPFRAEKYDPHLRVDLLLDGKSVPAIIDTGAPTTSLSDQAARDWFQIDDKTPGVEKLGHDALRYRFKALELEGLVVQNPEITIVHGAITDRPNYEALVGLSTLRQLHLYIAYKEHKLYVTSATAH
jgi:predicted aspartyl protease